MANNSCSIRFVVGKRAPRTTFLLHLSNSSHVFREGIRVERIDPDINNLLPREKLIARAIQNGRARLQLTQAEEFVAAISQSCNFTAEWWRSEFPRQYQSHICRYLESIRRGIRYGTVPSVHHFWYWVALRQISEYLNA